MIERVVIEVAGPKVIPPAAAARPAPLDDLRRRAVRRRVGGRAMASRRQRRCRSSRRRATTSRPTSASPTPPPASFARCSKKRARPSSSRATAASTGATCPRSNEAIWFSQRENWGHLYLHDLQTGKLKHPITSGEGNVTQLLRVDEANRMLYFQGVGRERGRDPYFRHFYRVGMDGKRAAAAHAGRRRSRHLGVALGRITSSTTTRSRTCPPRRCCATPPAKWCCRSKRWTSAACSPPDGSRRCRSR